MLVAAHAGMDEEARAVIVSVVGQVNHRTVRVEVFEAIEPGPYRYWVTVRDEGTRELLATGNPAESADRALEDVHWREVRSSGLRTSEDW